MGESRFHEIPIRLSTIESGGITYIAKSDVVKLLLLVAPRGKNYTTDSFLRHLAEEIEVQVYGR